MKKHLRKLLALFLALLLCLLFTACGASSLVNRIGGKSTSAAAAPRNESAGGSSAFYDAAPAYDMDYVGEEYSVAVPSAMSGGSFISGGNNDAARAETNDKIIYSGSASVETIRFDETVEQVYALIEQYGGFLESSWITGKDYNSTYYNRPNYRSASFVIRVPRESFQSFTGSLESLGNVINSSVQAQNITSSYFDTQSRLNTYRTEEERLLDMLSKADTVEDMLNIEDRLASVRYNIESLTTTLTNWDSKVNYSTLDLYISEVKELTQETPITRTFGEELGQGFRNTCQWMAQAAKDLAIYLVSILPVILLLAVIAVVVILIIRAKRHKKRAKKDVESAR